MCLEIPPSSGGGSLSNKLEIVSYDGNELYGVDNPCSVTFSFAPKVIIYLARASNGGSYPGAIYDGPDDGWIVACEFLTESFQKYLGLSTPGNTSYGYGKTSSDKKRFIWYNTKSANAQLNASGFRYYFLGIA